MTRFRHANKYHLNSAPNSPIGGQFEATTDNLRLMIVSVQGDYRRDTKALALYRFSQRGVKNSMISHTPIRESMLETT
jgi:hypothetical protein